MWSRPGPDLRRSDGWIADLVALLTTLRGRGRDWFVRRHGWVWLLPLGVFEIIHHYQSAITKPFELLIAVPFVLLVATRPYQSLSALLVILPFNTFLLTLLYRLGLPGKLAWGIGFWKEGVLAGLALAAFNRLQRRRRLVSRLRFDAIDKVVGAYVLLGSLYLVLPKLFVSGTVGAHLSFYLRELGWRTDVLYLALFLVCRHLGLTRPQVEALLRRVVAVGVVLALGGFYEFFLTGAWMRFILRTLRLGSFEVHVLKFPNPTLRENYATLGGHHFPRISSFLFFDYLGLGFYLVICLGIGVELMARGKHPRWMLTGVPVIAVGILLNQGRATIAGAAVAVAFALRAQLGRSIQHRVRLSLAIVLVLIVAIPVSIETGLEHRFVSSHSSNSGHTSATQTGLHVMASSPLGRGLGTGAGAGQAAVQKGQISGSSFLVTEDQLLQIGTQLGYIGGVLYIVSLGLIGYRLARPRLPPRLAGYGAPAGGIANAMVGLLVGIFVLQPFVTNAVDWTFFSLAGAAVGLLDVAKQDEVTMTSYQYGEGVLRTRWNYGAIST